MNFHLTEENEEMGVQAKSRAGEGGLNAARKK